MKLAIISDIHGNIHALEAVLHDIEKLNVDQVMVNGDMVNRAPHNIKVLERLMGRDYIITLGNHEDLLCKWIERDESLPADWFGSRLLYTPLRSFLAHLVTFMANEIPAYLLHPEIHGAFIRKCLDIGVIRERKTL